MPRRKAGPSGLSPEFIKFVAEQEGGERKYRDPETGIWSPYEDAAGFWTIGRGHLIGDGKSGPGEFEGGITDEQVAEIFKKDLARAREQARQTVGAADFDKLDLERQEMLVDMSFNLGGKFNKEKWPNFIGAVMAGDRKTALAESRRTYLDPKDNVRKPLQKRNADFLEFFKEEE